MQPRTLAAALLAPMLCAAEPGPALLDTAGPIPLAPAHAPQLFKQCSRRAPIGVRDVSIPSSESVAQLEARISKFISDVRNAGHAAPLKSTQYRGQHAAFRRGEKEFIYGSYVPSYAAASRPLDGQALVVCDGGAQFWGIVYDPASKQFSELALNGPP